MFDNRESLSYAIEEEVVIGFVLSYAIESVALFREVGFLEISVSRLIPPNGDSPKECILEVLWLFITLNDISPSGHHVECKSLVPVRFESLRVDSPLID